MQKVSVVLTTYNRANTYLKEAIQGMISQDYENIEFIIYNNGSTDNTDEVIEPYLQDKRIKYIKREVNSVSEEAMKERKILYSELDAEFVLNIHDDDIMSPNMVSEQMKVMEQDREGKIGIVSTNAVVINQDGKVIQDKLLNMKADYIYPVSEFKEKFKIGMQNNIIYPTCMYRKKKLLEVWDKITEKVSSFGPIVDRLVELCVNEVAEIYIISQNLYFYRKHMSQDSSNQSRIDLYLLKQLIPYLKENCRKRNALELIQMENELIQMMKCRDILKSWKKIIESKIKIQKDICLQEDRDGGNMESMMEQYSCIIQYVRNLYGGESKDYYIWGTGSSGLKTKMVIDKYLPNFKLVGYIDSFSDGELNEKKVYQKDKFKFDNNVFIFIAAKPAGYEIYNFLKEKGLEELDNFVYGPNFFI